MKLKPKRRPYKERWKVIEGYDGLYSVSNKGGVRVNGRVIPKGGERKRQYTMPDMPLHPTVSHGAAKVAFRHLDRTRTWVQLKDLVAKYWLRPFKPGARVYLRDRTNPKRCGIANLAQVGVTTNRGSMLSAEDVLKIKQDLKEIGKIRGVYSMLARRYDVHRWTICSIAHERRWKHIRLPEEEEE